MSVEQERRQASERVATLHLTRTAGGYLYIWPCPPHDRDDLGDYLDVMIRSLTQEVEMLGDVIVTGYDWEDREGPTLDGLPLGWVFFLITLFTRELVPAPESTAALPRSLDARTLLKPAEFADLRAGLAQLAALRRSKGRRSRG